MFVKFSPSYETKQFESSELNLKTHQKHHHLYENFFWGKKELGYFLKTSKMLKFSLKGMTSFNERLVDTVGSGSLLKIPL